MKRSIESDDELEGDSACPRQAKMLKKLDWNNGKQIRLLIPSHVAGSLIGKGGSRINRLRDENQALVSVPDCDGPERVIRISSNDMENTYKVVTQALEIMREDRTNFENSKDDCFEIRALFHNSQIGCIIGKGGSKIKEIRESTKSFIKVYKRECPRSTDRVVALRGSLEVCMNALRQMNSQAEKAPTKDPIENYDPRNYDSFNAIEYGGFGRRNDDDQQESRRGPVTFPRGSPPFGVVGGGRNIGGRGDPLQFRNQGFNRGEIPEHFRQKRENPSSTDQQQIMEQVTIPNECAGAIIGKQGARIRSIRVESGANIAIGRPQSGVPDRIITIIGSPGQIRMAQHLLQRSVLEYM